MATAWRQPASSRTVPSRPPDSGPQRTSARSPPEPPPCSLYRGWNPRYAPEHTGRIRLCKATFYRDVDPSLPAIRDEQEGETRIQAQGSVEREGSELSDTTLTVMGDDGKLSGVARLERGQTSATFEQNLGVGYWSIDRLLP